jgi:hypothetical protein
MNRFSAVFALVGTLVVMHSSASNAQLVYDNGPINGTFTARTIVDGLTVSDSFTVSSPTNLISATAGLWLSPGDTTSQIDWAIGTTAFGTDVASGTSVTTDAFQFTNGDGFDIYEDSFAIGGTVAPGTYFLSLQNAVATNDDLVFWDENSGPSLAFQTSNGAVPSESFQIFGPGAAAATPEPGAYAMLVGMGLSGLAVLRRRRRVK